jgi:hypothetical protein
MHYWGAFERVDYWIQFSGYACVMYIECTSVSYATLFEHANIIIENPQLYLAFV